MAVKIQLRRGTQSEFNSANPTLLDGEVALVTDDKKIIVGPGAYNTLNAEGKFINFHTDQGLGTVGGANATGEIPIKLVGASGQTVAALQVLKNGGSNGILEVFTDNTTELVKINGADGAVDDITLLLKAKASQTAGVFEVQDSSATTPRFQVKEEGQTLIQPADTTDVSLDVKGSTGSQSNGILRVQASDGSTNLLKVEATQNSILKETLLGSIPDHATPSTPAKIKSGTNPGNTDSGALTNYFELEPHFTLLVEGGATDNQRGKLSLVGNRDADSGDTAFQISKNGTELAKLAADYAGNITAKGVGTFADLDVDVTGRTLSSASVPRLDEIVGLTGPFTFTTDTATDTDYNTNVEHLLPLDIASSSHDFATKTTFPNQPNLTLVPISGTSASPNTNGQFGTGTGDTTNAHLLRIPANSGRMQLKITLTSGTSLGNNTVGGVARFYSYTAQTATSSDNKTLLGGGSVATLTLGSGINTVSGSLKVSNSTVEKFVAVSFDGDFNTDGSDLFSYTFEVSRDGETVVAL